MRRKEVVRKEGGCKEGGGCEEGRRLLGGRL